jgi:hypothetical protein
LAGVTVRVDVPVLPWTMVNEAGFKAAVIEGGIAVMVTVCGEETDAAKVPSPL